MICYKAVKKVNNKLYSTFAGTFGCAIEYKPNLVIKPKFGYIFAYLKPDDMGS
jgi:hypothetical protein